MCSLKITMIGSGNIAFHLSKALMDKEVIINQVYSRNLSRGQELASLCQCSYCSSADQIDESSDIYLFVVSDSAIAEVLKYKKWNNKLLVHAAGSIPMQVFENYSMHYGVIYPLQSFSKFRELNYADIPFALEASSLEDEQILRGVIKQISQKIYRLDSNQRLTMHLSAVFVSNFVNHMLTIAKELGQAHDIPFDLFHPLIHETIAKALEWDPIQAQTGPARRNDQGVIQAHINQLQSYPDWKKIYTFTSESIVNFYKMHN